MLIKNQVYETVITDYTSEGQGVAHIEGCAVFIPNAIAGERVTVRIEKAQKTWAARAATKSNIRPTASSAGAAQGAWCMLWTPSPRSSS